MRLASRAAICSGRWTHRLLHLKLQGGGTPEVRWIGQGVPCRQPLEPFGEMQVGCEVVALLQDVEVPIAEIERAPVSVP